VLRRESQIVLGLDPDPCRLWPEAESHAGGAGAESASPAARAAAAVIAHGRAVIRAVASECVAVKPQVACFEALGTPGWDALRVLVDVGHEAGLLVIADAKRGDIGITAAAYGRSFFGAYETPFGVLPSLGVDALTVNPYMGADALAPLVDSARAVGGGLFVLARTSNPGAADLQDLPLAAGGRVSEAAAGLIERVGRDVVGASGLSDVGAVVGATAPERIRRLRELMPTTVFLLPGVGAQGGRVEDLADVFTPGPAAGLIAASRGIVFAGEQPGAAAARREAARLRELTWELSH
jgi:orotidine-5'-phosphate decarboxylase